MASRTLSRTIKILHTLGTVGTLGSLAALLVLARAAPPAPLSAYAAARVGMAAVSNWLLMPSLAVVLASGLLAMMANRAYLHAGWAWLKALLGISMFEGTLLSVVGTSRQAAQLAALAAQGAPDPDALAALLRTERGGLWLMAALSVANIVIGVWRPRWRYRPGGPSPD